MAVFANFCGPIGLIDSHFIPNGCGKRIVRESAIGFGVLFNPFSTDALGKIDIWRAG